MYLPCNLKALMSDEQKKVHTLLCHIPHIIGLLFGYLNGNVVVV